MLLKFVDGMVHDEEKRNIKDVEITDFISIFQSLVHRKLKQILVSPDQFGMEEIETLTSSVRLVLADLELLLHSPSPPVLRESSTSDLCRISLGIARYILPNVSLFTASC